MAGFFSDDPDTGEAPTQVGGYFGGGTTFAGGSLTPGQGIALTDLSVGPEGAPSGDGDLSYSNTNGVFTYTPPDLSAYLQGLPNDLTLYPMGLARDSELPVVNDPAVTFRINGSDVGVISMNQANTEVVDFGTIGGGGGGNPIPSERFNISLNPSELTQGSGSTTVTATVSVNSPFVLTGFNRTEVHSASSSVPTMPESNSGLTGQSATFSFVINPTVAETWNVSAQLFSENSSGTAQPNHTVSRQLHVNVPWYADALTSAPTALSQLTNRGVYRSGVSYTFPALTNGRGYFALPNGITPTFMTGSLFLTATSTPIGSTHTLYTLSTNDYDGTGTLTVEVTS